MWFLLHSHRLIICARVQPAVRECYAYALCHPLRDSHASTLPSAAASGRATATTIWLSAVSCAASSRWSFDCSSNRAVSCSSVYATFAIDDGPSAAEGSTKDSHLALREPPPYAPGVSARALVRPAGRSCRCSYGRLG